MTRLSKVAFTDPAGDDPGWRSTVGFGYCDTNEYREGGHQCQQEEKFRRPMYSPKNNGAIIIMATYRVTVYAPYDTKINFGGGSFSYKDPTTGSLNSD